MPETLSYDDLDCLIEGAAFLGSGGGGPVPLARQLLKTMEERGLTPQLAHFSEMPPDAWVASVAGIGSPEAASTARSPFTEAPRRMVQALESAMNRSLDALIPGETGPMNSLIPMMAGAQLGKPVIDGDGAGRAMATLTMSTFNEVAPIQPYVVGNDTEVERDQVAASLTLRTPHQADALTRGIVSEPGFGSCGAFATWPCQLQTLTEAAVHDSVGQAMEVGSLLKRARQAGADPVSVLKSFFGDRMRTLYTGTIDRVDSHTAQGFDITQIRMTAAGEPDLTLYALNENMVAWRDDLAHPLAVGPDSLCYVTSDGHAFTNANLADFSGPEHCIHLIGLEALPALRAPSILAAYRSVLIPMGYPGPYRPLSQWEQPYGND